MADEARFLAARGLAPQIAVNPFPGREGWFAQLRAEGLLAEDFDPPRFFEDWRWRRCNWLRARVTAVPWVRRRRPRLAHVFWAWTETGGSRLWLAHRAGVPAVVSVHNAFPPHRFSDWHRALLREAFRTVRGVYAVSASAMRHYEAIFGEFFPAGLVRAVVHNFVDMERFRCGPEARALARARLGVADDAFLVGTVGRLDVQKQPLAVLEVFARLQGAVPSARLAFVGAGPLEAPVRARAEELGLGDRVIFTGFRKDVEALLPGLDVHVLLSRNEGFGIATAEAMACGVPVVGTDVPGTADVIAGSGAGLLLPRGDAEGTAAALAALAADPVRRARLGEAGRVWVAQRFARPVWEAGLERFYGQVLGEPVRAGAAP